MGSPRTADSGSGLLHLQSRLDLSEDVEVLVLRQNDEAMDESCGRDYRVHRSSTAALCCSGSEEVCQFLRYRFVIRQRDKALRAGKSRATKRARILVGGSTNAE